MTYHKLFLFLAFTLATTTAPLADTSTHCTLITNAKTQQIFHKSGEACNLVLGKNSPLNITIPTPPATSNEYLQVNKLDNGWTIHAVRGRSWQVGKQQRQQAWYAGWATKNQQMLTFITAVIEGAPAKGSAAHRLQRSFHYQFSKLIAE